MKITERLPKKSCIKLIIIKDFLEFLEKRDRVWIGVLLLPSGQLATVFEPPSTSKNKGVFFFKREEEPVPKEVIKNLVTFGDLSALPLDQFGAFVDDIMDDILVHQDMATSWPKVVSGDVQSSMNKLKSEVYEITGSMKGRTLLPMPADQALQVREIAAILQSKQSSYYDSLTMMYDDVKLSLEEARDISIHLKPLRSLLDDIEQTDLSAVEKKLGALLHLVSLIWATSDYYRHPAKIVVLLGEIANFVIDLTKTFIDGESIFKGELDESYDLIKIALKTLRSFKEMYFEYSSKLPQYFSKTGKKTVLWDFRPELVFHRFDRFLKRIELIEEFFLSSISMMNLEKVEIGDSASVESMFKLIAIASSLIDRKIIGEDFDPKYKKLVQQMEVEIQQARELFENQRDDPPLYKNQPPTAGKIRWAADLLQRVKTPRERFFLLDHPFVKNDEAQLVFKKFDEFEKFVINFKDATYKRWVAQVDEDCQFNLTKPLLSRDAETKLMSVNFNPKLEAVLREVRYLGYLGYENLPTSAENLYKKDQTFRTWVSSLRQTVHWYNKIRTTILEVEFPLVESQLAFIDVLLSKGESQLSWSGEVYDYIKEIYDAVADLQVRTQRATDNVSMMEEIMATWMSSTIFERKSDTKEPGLINLVNKNERIQKRYQKITMDGEQILNLLKENIEHFKADSTTAAWGAYKEFVDDDIYKISSLVVRISGNESYQDLMENHVTLGDLRNDIMSRVRKVISDAEIFTREFDSYTYLWHDDSQEFLRQFLTYGHILTEEEIQAHAVEGIPETPPELDQFKEQIDSYEDLFEVVNQFSPEKTFDGWFKVSLKPFKHSLLNILKKWSFMFKDHLINHIEKSLLDLEDFIEETDSGLSKPVQTGDFESLVATMGHIKECKERQEKNDTMFEPLKASIELLKMYNHEMSEDVFRQLSDLPDKWANTKKILVGAKQNVAPLQSAQMTEIKNDANEFNTLQFETPPELDQFKEQIDSYEDLFEVVNQFSPEKTFDGWFKVSLKPFKHSLLNILKKWSFMFKDHLINHIEKSLLDLEDFIEETDSGLSKPVQTGDFESLVATMGHIKECKERQEKNDTMFEPLKASIELLKMYNHEMSEDVFRQLSDLPDKWANTKKILVGAKQNVAPLQSAQMTEIKNDANEFNTLQFVHREGFRKLNMFNFDSNDPYGEVNVAHAEIKQMEDHMQELEDNANLFEVNLPEFKQLRASRKDLGLVKEVWDLTKIVTSSMSDWKTTLWSEIDIETMENDTKRFAKDIRKVDKEARGWDVFSGLETEIKNMITSLRVVAELQNPSIRDRHWHQLMNATGVRFTMNEKTTLFDLLNLNLHQHEETVREIVDKSSKEMGMEKMLKDLEQTWSSLEFETDKHGETMLIRSSEDLVEVLEDNQVQLQNLMSSKYIAHFLEAVSGWQKKLSTTDTVMSLWLEVQRTWSYLESIFIGSEDIRRQLPEDSDRFDGIDRDFKIIMKEAENDLNVVNATNKQGLFEKLESLQERLTLCEKSLAEYLETKRLIFPRFYFVSTTTLLDILSNGNNPRVIAKHLSKLFDNTTDLKFKGESKSAIGMFSSEREYVDFQEECSCDGQVEVWLNRVMDSMRAAVRHYLAEAVVTYEEKAREKWLFDYAAQVALTTTQIWWTTEVGISFGRLEEGYENAMKEYSKKQITQLNNLITLLLGDLSKGDRQKIMTICTIDVHARDVVLGLIADKTDNSQDFIWQRQMRARWEESQQHCFVNACDAQFKYSYEYLGNTPRLVVTPLTDRCYITLTQSLHLIMGGAPAGPAGTGKTETTKDLGRAIGIKVYVFNCSEQMDYKSVGNIYKGLAQTGAWGCFDEFNRIAIEVLSVVAVQVKTRVRNSLGGFASMTRLG
ncbi:unnamed protein product [Oikopleura dioica]|uniref:Uncharacterized protein n=1 Tax=Oikopleura dioica TaxID=34765 RepID=E4XGM6_OIKDI|nr:unnamed protein product [Oikopleura dioica]